MKIGVHQIAFTVPEGAAGIAPELARLGAAVEAAGATHLSVMDHYFQMEARFPATDPMLEGYTTLGFLAAHTRTVRLGLLVTGITYRHPGLLAKIVSTLDVLSEGRGQLGIGAAWYDREHHGLGVPFPPTAERFERLEETLQVCLQMWDQDNDGPYDGKHYQLAETLCHPAPISKPPILIGGGGEKKTLRLVAKYADACNLFGTSPEDVAHKLDVLRRHCDDVGRDYDTIRKTANLGVPISDSTADDLAAYAKLGIETMIVMPPGDAPARYVEEKVAPLVPQVADL
ncbi:LLM class F420-dependent oxidoreductase [Actinophytocola oryzae]|uniref:F420-dependent oxidoreductase-like protein n=1 Tax=Actinophytocola oryzae TaxID=502181 RepID=A0A4R7VWD2_9PSEU|nr:LLM class F420-dependent oxidoreductase [Actinophytocola oryzae]TDV53789.1 F420-dependent oxidoreductase-like protein [Actinophytocola oryzae]